METFTETKPDPHGFDLPDAPASREQVVRIPYNEPQTWYFTFGVGDPQFAGQFYVIEGVGGEEARDRMNEIFAGRWAFQYDEADWFKHGISQAEKYGLTEIPQ